MIGIGATRKTNWRKFGWAVTIFLLMALAIPWFLWRNATVAYGLPVWLWWHVGWMVVVALVFRAFARRAWGLGVTDDAVTGDGVTSDTVEGDA